MKLPLVYVVEQKNLLFVWEFLPKLYLSGIPEIFNTWVQLENHDFFIIYNRKIAAFSMIKFLQDCRQLTSVCLFYNSLYV